MTLSRVSRIRSKDSWNKEAYGSNWKLTTYAVREKENWRCSGCNKFFNTEKRKLHSHHIIPLSKGGNNSISNLKALCVDCHAKEHNHHF